MQLYKRLIWSAHTGGVGVLENLRRRWYLGVMMINLLFRVAKTISGLLVVFTHFVNDHFHH